MQTADRLSVINNHLLWYTKSVKTSKRDHLQEKQSIVCNPTRHLNNGRVEGVQGVEVEAPPPGLEEEYATILTPEALQFVAQLVMEFDQQVEMMLKQRIKRKVELDISGDLPDFTTNPELHEKKWKIAPVPKRIQCRFLDLGDVSPAYTNKFTEALKCPVNGIQVDFDDGNCPTWRNQIRGLYNIHQAVHGLISDVPPIDKAPILMLRPRAWNMIENNMLVNGKAVPGPLFDYGLLMFHCSQQLVSAESGPFFYLSKLEGANEAQLWNNIFIWTQNKLKIPQGTIKACVLIENILASFEMEEILYALRDHSLGLNCGIWDYSASFVNKFGTRKDFVLPDRNKYVNMQRHFLKSYMDLVICTCHKHGAHATGGMAATILTSRDLNLVTGVIEGKMREILAGCDGFMVYDTKLVAPVMKMMGPAFGNQIHRQRDDVRVRSIDLLEMPSGGVTLAGLRHNIAVGILFIDSWLRGEGHFIYKGAVEDSATAEISRSQVWQWIRHQALLEDNGEVITRGMVQEIIRESVDTIIATEDLVPMKTEEHRNRLCTAAEILEEIITKRDFPEFITTYLSQDHTFLKYQKLYLH
ncbi:unnamed protein product [Meganyctiphanes norvegica]|uniref:malate synthase n=1 Tax=Meganyctiphanes norvegica TaxID=48144 RepID=A0AAV2QBE5_MEGNR